MNTSIFFSCSNKPPSLPGERTSSFIKNESFSFDKRNNVGIARCEFDSSRYHRKLYDELNVPFPNELDNAHTKRLAEFLAGRYIAQKTLQELCNDVSHIPSNENRVPLWPDGVTASISHTNSVAVCAASLSCHNNYLGVDIENWISPRNANKIKRVVIDSREEHLLNGVDISFEKALTIAFSAKESFFKAIHNHVGKLFEFEAAKISTLSIKDKSVTLVASTTLSPLIPESKFLECKYSIDESGVMTLLSGKL